MSWLKSRLSKNGWMRVGRVYILPTKFGLAFAAGSILMILIGSAYSNNLVNLLGFFMLAILFTAMIATHNNISGIEVSRIESIFGFAGEQFPVSMVVHNPTKYSKTNCDFTIRGFKKAAQYDARTVISPQSDSRLLASFESPARGVHRITKIVLSTTAPFDLFYAWQIRNVEADATIYPKRKGDLMWSELSGNHLADINRDNGSENYKEHSLYQDGDNLRRVDWLAYARGHQLMTKKFDEATGTGLYFDFHKINLNGNELRLEQLAKWIDLAIQRGQSFSLAISGKTLGPDRGLAFAHRAWSELAKFSEEPAPPKAQQ